jgi:hypothetical protein
VTRRTVALWSVVALLGLGLAAGVSLGVRALTNQDVGLASESITAGEELAPPPERAEPTAARSRREARRRGRLRARREAREPGVASPGDGQRGGSPPVPPTTTFDDGSVDGDFEDGGRGRGRGRGRSGGDPGSSGSGSDGSGSDSSGSDGSGSSGSGPDGSGDDD